ncbi:MAG: hypothetical protein WCO62_00285 [Betaproteobacteria bacterium]
MSIDKSLYAAPQGLGALNADPISVEIVDPEEMHIEGPGFEMHIEHGNETEFDTNIAELMPDNQLLTLAYDLLGEVEEDINSRKDWLDTYVKGLQLLGLKYEERTEPWPGACGVYHPLLMEAAVKFQSETIMETFPAAGPVRTMIIGKETQEKKDAAARVEADMNFQLTEVMQEYRPEHERALLTVALAGNAFKKIYFDPSLGRQVAPFIAPEDIIVPYGATNIETAERITHRMRKTKNELRKLQVAGFYRDVDLGDPLRIMDEVEKRKAEQQGFSASMDDRFQILEIHCNLDLPGYEDEDSVGPTGIKLPYVVTIEKGTSTVLAIRRNWLEDDKLKLRRQHFDHYGYIPGFGFYYFGLIHLIGGHSKAATSLMRQLIDAGTLSNLPGGLKSKGLRVKGDDTPIAPGEFRDVDLPSGSIRDNILPLPYKEPSQVLAALMDKVVEDARRFAGSADLNVSDMSSQAPVGTTLAVLERSLKVMGAIQARIHYTMKQEFKLLAAIIRDNTPEDYDYEPATGVASAKRSDYDHCDVLPVSDPNASTMAQRVVQYQAVLQLAQSAPQIYNLPLLHRQMIETLGVKNADKLVPMKDDMQPVDPISENMFIMVGNPVKAFIYQNHEAHIQAHMAAMHDPLMMQVIGQNPQAQQIAAAGAAHLMEHVAFKYRQEIEKQLGSSLPPPPDLDNDTGYLSPEIEVQLSALVSQAAQQLLQNNQQQAAQQQAQQQMQDPLIQMQQMELQIKQQEVQIKQQMAQGELQVAQQELQIKAQQAQSQTQLQQAEQQRKAKKDVMDAAGRADELKLKQLELQITHELGGAKLGVDIAHKKRTHISDTAHKADQNQLEQSKHELEGAKLGVDMAHRKAEHQADVAHKLDEHDIRRDEIKNMAKGGEVKSEKYEEDESGEDDDDSDD